MLLGADIGHMTAMAAIHAHELADFEKAANQVSNMWYKAMDNVPYVMGGMTAEDAQHAERMRAVEQFKSWQLQERDDYKLSKKETAE